MSPSSLLILTVLASCFVAASALSVKHSTPSQNGDVALDQHHDPYKNWVPPKPRVPCPCEDPALCEPIRTPFPQKQVWGWQQAQGENIQFYDYDRLTTISAGGGYNKDLLCYAHYRGVRVVGRIFWQYDFHNITNATLRTQWIDNWVQTIVDWRFDGLDIDIENNLNRTRHPGELLALNELVAEMTNKTRRSIAGGGQMSFCVANQPFHNGGRQYDYDFLAKTVDYLLIMDYCTWSMAPGLDHNPASYNPPKKCYAGPNAPAFTAIQGIQQYLSVQQNSSKFILGVPWFMYLYPCKNGTSPTAEQCEIPWTKFGEKWYCSDAPAYQTGVWPVLATAYGYPVPGWGYNRTTNITENTTAVGMGSWARLNTIDVSDMSVHQAWFDTASTLEQKYEIAKNFSLGGVAIWNLDCLEVAGHQHWPKKTRMLIETYRMWKAIDVFLK